MSTSVERVQAAVTAFGRGEIPTLLDMCDDNVEVVFPVSEPTTIPIAGSWRGKSRLADYFRLIVETFDVLKWEPSHYVGNGDRVVAFGSMDVRAKSTGKLLTNSLWALEFSVANDTITGWHVYADSAGWEKALTAA